MFKDIELLEIVSIAKKAGDAVMKIYSTEFEVEYKNDNSPLTLADKVANEIICNDLSRLYPDIPILSEENKEILYEQRMEWEFFWCIDPIDGTMEFIEKNDEFTINIALIKKDTPVLGVVYAPAIGVMYYAKHGSGAFKNGFRLPLKKHSDKLVIVASRSHLSHETSVFIDNIKTDKPKELISVGSSLKFCLVAEGSADIYPRLSDTMEWDTAAAHAICLEADTFVLDINTNQPLKYNKESLLNGWFEVSRRC